MIGQNRDKDSITTKIQVWAEKIDLHIELWVQYLIKQIEPPESE